MLKNKLTISSLLLLLLSFLKTNGQCNQKEYLCIKTKILNDKKYEFVELSERYIVETNSKNTLIDRMLEKYQADSLCKFIFYRVDSLQLKLVSQKQNELNYGRNDLKVRVRTKIRKFETQIENIDSVHNVKYYTLNNFPTLLPIKKKHARVLDNITIQTKEKKIELKSDSFYRLICPVLKSKKEFCKGIQIYKPSDISDYLYIYVYGSNLGQYYFAKIVINIKTGEVKIFTVNHDILVLYNSFHPDFIGF